MIAAIIKEFKQECRAAKSEDDIKRACNIFFHSIGKAFDLEIKSENEKVSAHGGRADSVYNDIIFELKKLKLFSKSGGIKEAVWGRDKNDHGIFHYLVNFSLENCSQDFDLFMSQLYDKVGIAFDGDKFVICRFKPDTGLMKIYDKRKTKKYPAHFPHEAHVAFEVSEAYDFESGVRMILLFLRSTKRKKLTSEYLCDSFSSNSVITQKTIPYLYKLLDESLNSNMRVRTLYDEWNRIFGTIYEKQETDFVQHVTAIKRLYNVADADQDIDVKKALFCIQTYYSIVIKILIQNLYNSLRNPNISMGALRDISDVVGLFNGEKNSFKTTIDNFFEIHFFEWFTLVDNLEISNLNEIIAELDQFETTASVIKPEIVSDVLRRTYESLIPKELRHLMGEYYTVDWLADFTLDKSGIKTDINTSAIDPTCGSGIFLTHLIKRFLKEHRGRYDHKTLIHYIIRNYVGFDINPIAVIQCKGNYILSLGDITQIESPISIPVYMCDSILVPTVHAKQKLGEKFIDINTVVGNFKVPIFRKRKDSDNFLKLLSVCILSGYKAFETFEKRLKNEHGIVLEGDEKELARSLFYQMLSLHMSGKDGFWPIIIKNSFAPLFSEQKFDYVIGNPPWIGWKAMSESYRNLTLDIWLSYGIFEKNAYDKITSHDDFAMAVTYVAIDHYLKPNGTAALILPQTFVKSLKGGEGFRKFCITRDIQVTPFKVSAVYDMLNVNPFKGIAANKTSVYLFTKSKAMTYPMDSYYEGYIKSGESLNTTDPYEVAISKIGFKKLSAKPINDDVRSPWLTLDSRTMNDIEYYLGESSYKGRKGIEPCGAKGIYLVDIVDKRGNNVIIENLVARSRLQVIKDIGVYRGEVEKELVYPIVGGRNIDKWGLNSFIYMLVPHYSTGRAVYRGIPEEVMQTNYFRTYDWLYHFHDILLETRIRSAKFFDKKQFPWYRLDNVGDYTFQPYKVLWKEQSVAMNCCVVSTLNCPHLGDKIVVADSKVLTASFDTKEEAHYLCAILNSSAIEEIIQAYTISTNRGTDIVKNIKIPKFDLSNLLHLQIARASENAHASYIEKDSNKIHEAETLINELVPQIFIEQAKISI